MQLVSPGSGEMIRPERLLRTLLAGDLGAGEGGC